MSLPIKSLEAALRHSGLVRFLEHYEALFAGRHLKDLVVDALGPYREMDVGGRQVINFGSDSFLGLDQDPRVQAALMRGVRKWGSHNGASRAFSSVRANEEAERSLAAWLGTEEALIYPSVTLANMGALPALLAKQDVLILDEHAHNSMHEGAKIARANGTRIFTFSHGNPQALEKAFAEARPYRVALVAIDGVYSMTGELPPLARLNDVCQKNDAVLYVDDAHGTGVLGRHGRGTVLDGLGSYENVLVVGSLSKAFSCFGGFIGCPAGFKKLLKMRSNTFLFGGPVPPAYLEAIRVVCEILSSAEYALLHARLARNCRLLLTGAERLDLVVLGGSTPIMSVLIGDEEMTLAAGHFLFEQGYYVQSVTFPAVPYHAGVLRIQVNANHKTEALEGLIAALAEMKGRFALPLREERWAA